MQLDIDLFSVKGSVADIQYTVYREQVTSAIKSNAFFDVYNLLFSLLVRDTFIMVNGKLRDEFEYEWS